MSNDAHEKVSKLNECMEGGSMQNCPLTSGKYRDSFAIVQECLRERSRGRMTVLPKDWILVYFDVDPKRNHPACPSRGAECPSRLARELRFMLNPTDRTSGFSLLACRLDRSSTLPNTRKFERRTHDSQTASHSLAKPVPPIFHRFSTESTGFTAKGRYWSGESGSRFRRRLSSI